MALKKKALRGISMSFNKNSHCSYCGIEFIEQVKWPRHCNNCSNTSWSNPTPVVIVMLVVSGDDGIGGYRYGLLIQERAIEPKKGEWALTGGYIDAGETWQQAAVREVKEELGISTKESSYQLYDVASSTNKENILIFCAYNFYLNESSLKSFVANEEVTAINVMWEAKELAFPAHSECANKYLKLLNLKG
jgi:8-oxo-dGTP pyrophosphatase MutT (NUDIX family)